MRTISSAGDRAGRLAARDRHWRVRSRIRATQLTTLQRRSAAEHPRSSPNGRSIATAAGGHGAAPVDELALREVPMDRRPRREPYPAQRPIVAELATPTGWAPRTCRPAAAATRMPPAPCRPPRRTRASRRRVPRRRDRPPRRCARRALSIPARDCERAPAAPTALGEVAHGLADHDITPRPAHHRHAERPDLKARSPG